MSKTISKRNILIALIDKKLEYFPEAIEKVSSGVISKKSLSKYFTIISNLIDDLRLDQEESLKRSKQKIQEKVEILKREIPLRESIKKNSYHLQDGSPCINTGNPGVQYNDTDGSRNDMGAYGGPNGDW